MPSGTRFDLIDRGGCRLACVTVTECDGDLVHGVMEDALSVHNEIFGEWYRAVEEQRLADVDRLDQQIAALSITAVEVPGGGRLATGDLERV